MQNINYIWLNVSCNSYAGIRIQTKLNDFICVNLFIYDLEDIVKMHDK